MSEDLEKIKRAIASFNNQIARINAFANLFSIGNLVRVNLENEVTKLEEDRDTLAHSLSHTTDSTLDSQVKTKKDKIGKNDVMLVSRAQEIEKAPGAEILHILKKMDKNSISKPFLISLTAGIPLFILGLVIGLFFS